MASQGRAGEGDNASDVSLFLGTSNPSKVVRDAHQMSSEDRANLPSPTATEVDARVQEQLPKPTNEVSRPEVPPEATLKQPSQDSKSAFGMAMNASRTMSASAKPATGSMGPSSLQPMPPFARAATLTSASPSTAPKPLPKQGPPDVPSFANARRFSSSGKPVVPPPPPPRVHTAMSVVDRFPTVADTTAEKQMLLIALSREDQTKLSRKFSMADSVADMQFELKRIQMARDEAQMVGMMSDGLRVGFGAFELGVTKLRIASLSGWAEEATANMDQYQPALSKLYRKYCTKATVAPEMELLFAIGGSLVKHQVGKRLNKALRPGSNMFMDKGPGTRPPASQPPNFANDDDSDAETLPSDSSEDEEGDIGMTLPSMLSS